MEFVNNITSYNSKELEYTFCPFMTNPTIQAVYGNKVTSKQFEY